MCESMFTEGDFIINGDGQCAPESSSTEEIDLLTRSPVLEALGQRAMEDFDSRQRLLYPESML